MSDQSETTEPPRKAGDVFYIDGMDHVVGSADCCRNDKPPCQCGGVIHVQGVYGGIVYECDLCGECS